MSAPSESDIHRQTTVQEKNRTQKKLINTIRTRLWRAKLRKVDEKHILRIQEQLKAAKSQFQEPAFAPNEKKNPDVSDGTRFSFPEKKEEQQQQHGKGNPKQAVASSTDLELQSFPPSRIRECVGSYERCMIWDKQTNMLQSLLDECPSCSKGFINPFFSPVLEDFSVFVCTYCADGVFFKLSKCSRTNQSPPGRLLVWLMFFKFDRFASCPICQNSTMDALSSSWHVAHDKARALGGGNSFDNLVPVCSDCNFGMGTRSVTEYRCHLFHLGLIGTAVSQPRRDVAGARFLLQALQTT
jgi:hypothetical protein